MSAPTAETIHPTRSLVLLSVVHAIRTPRDASNYIVRLGQVAPRMAEALVEARARAAKDLIPPRFIRRPRQRREPPS